MKSVSYIIPILVLSLLICSIIKRKNIYELFVKGTRETLPLIFSLFPYLCAILVMNELMKVSGLFDIIISVLSPVFSLFSVPKEVINLIILKPFSGSGSLAILNEIFIENGVNSFTSMLACCLYGSSETIFYISAVYYAKCKNKKATKAVIISLVASIISTVFTCFICKLFF